MTTYTGWHKSLRSGSMGENCVEQGVAPGGASVGVRDTKSGGEGPVLDFQPAAWRAFTDGVRSGAFATMS